MSNNKHNKSTRRTIDYEKSDQLNWKSFKWYHSIYVYFKHNTLSSFFI